MNSGNKIFISHAEKDWDIAEKIYYELKHAGLNPWMKSQDILPGQAVTSEIRKAIQNSSCFLALLSSNSVTKKGMLQQELKTALELFKELHSEDTFFIIPVRLDTCETMDEDLKYLQPANLFRSYEEGMSKIIRVLKRRITVPSRARYLLDLLDETQLKKRICFNWLHLTDLHQGFRSDWRWPGVKTILFKDLERLHDKSGPWDLVLFTGDFTQQGNIKEFQMVDKVLEQLWEYLDKLGSTPTLLAVPGNHDLVRPKKENASILLLRQWDRDVQAEFWDKDGSPYRRVVAKAFQNYTEWWNKQPFMPKNLNTGVLPGDFSTSIEKDGAKLGIVGLNTAFLQLTSENYKSKLALHARQFHEVCGGDGSSWAKKHHACLLLTHHPPAWLDSDSRKHLHGDITAHGRFAVHLCGHLHETAYRDISEGGAEFRRIWQGRSLFGLEYSGRGEEERLHGYTAGRIELNEDQGSLLFWPREARLQGGQRIIVPDYSMSLTDNQSTRPIRFTLLQPVNHDKNATDSQYDNQHRSFVYRAVGQKELDFKLRNEIVDFMQSIPIADSRDDRHTLILKAGLDRQLIGNISFDGLTNIFSELLIDTLLSYGMLNNGRDPLVALLEAVKNYVESDRIEECNALIQQLQRTRTDSRSEKKVDYSTISHLIEEHRKFTRLMNEVVYYIRDEDVLGAMAYFNRIDFSKQTDIIKKLYHLNKIEPSHAIDDLKKIYLLKEADDLKKNYHIDEAKDRLMRFEWLRRYFIPSIDLKLILELDSDLILDEIENQYISVADDESLNYFISEYIVGYLITRKFNRPFRASEYEKIYELTDIFKEFLRNYYTVSRSKTFTEFTNSALEDHFVSRNGESGRRASISAYPHRVLKRNW